MIRYPIKKVDMWYFNSYTLRHICNNRELFSNLQSKNYEFITIEREVIQFQEVETVHLSLPNGKITLFNIAYTSKYNSNLISLGQLCKLEISYYNHSDSIIF